MRTAYLGSPTRSNRECAPRCERWLDLIDDADDRPETTGPRWFEPAAGATLIALVEMYDR